MTAAAWRGDGTPEWDIAHGHVLDGRVAKISEHGGVEFVTDTMGTVGFGWDPAYGEPPHAGDHVRTYGATGRRIHGIDVNGWPRYYLTIADEDVAHQAWLDERQAQQRAEYEAEREDRDRRIAILPDSMRAKILALHQAGGEQWRIDSESYELFVLEQAAVLGAHFAGRPWALEDWWSRHGPGTEVPGWGPGHSGNTAACAYMTARLELDGYGEHIVDQAQALAPLAGDPRASTS